MKIVIVGVGYVGLITGICLAYEGNQVICIDSNFEKIEALGNGHLSIYEPDLDEMFYRVTKEGNIQFKHSFDCLTSDVQMCFIAVGTPGEFSGEVKLDYIWEAAKKIGECMEGNPHIVVKSTVPVGTCERAEEIIKTQLELRGISLPVSISSNPEFLREGNAVRDAIAPERIVIGVENEEDEILLRTLYEPYVNRGSALIVMDRRSAELTKYAANCFLATKISYINMIASICENTGADIKKVTEGIVGDSRIGRNYLNAGCGYGGSCLPKDVDGMISMGKTAGCSVDLLKAVKNINQRQMILLSKKVVKIFGKSLKKKVITIWGVAFKPNTDDIREATSLVVIRDLMERGAIIQVYDPVVKKDRIEKLFGTGNIRVFDEPYDALYEADALILMTEWSQFKSPDFDLIGTKMNQRVILDGRNLYEKKELDKKGFRYYYIGGKSDGL